MASIHSNLYIHPLDRSALAALKAIPGFTPLLKAYMKALSEQQFRIENMATHLRVSEKQLPEYYHMLLPICAKLGIEVPELYLKLDGSPNAYTSGDTRPFIVLTSGLIEKFPAELIPAVLAHECGHIACHHVLYHTMGSILLSTAASALGLSDLFTFPLQSAFAHWMRCSELSADRAAAIALDARDVVEYCIRFAGYPANAAHKPNQEAFMAQAQEYRAMMHESAWNKILELLMYSQADHPINAVRAYECYTWAQSEEYQNITRYYRSSQEQSLIPADVLCPLAEDGSSYVHRDSQQLQMELRSLGFHHVELKRSTTPDSRFHIGQTKALRINGASQLPAASWYPADAKVEIEYYEPLTDAEIVAMHPGQVRTPMSSRQALGSNYIQVIQALKEAGFTAFVIQEQRDSTRGWFTTDKEVVRISIDGHEVFEAGTWFQEDDVVRILYRVLPN